MGDSKKKYDIQMDLISLGKYQIRHQALEAARQTCNRALEKIVGKNQYMLKINTYPHHILRENPLAAGAGADRMSTGMSRSFGKLIGNAAQIKEGQPIITVKLFKAHEKTGKIALKRASYKFPFSYRIISKSLIPTTAQ